MNGLLDRLTVHQRRDIAHVGRMIARGDDEDDVRAAWSQFITGLPARTRHRDLDALVERVTQESYRCALDDLSYHAGNVGFVRVDQTVDRRQLAALGTDELRSELDHWVSQVGRGLTNAPARADRATIDLQNALERQRRMLQLMSSISKTLHDTAMAIVRNIG